MTKPSVHRPLVPRRRLPKSFKELTPARHFNPRHGSLGTARAGRPGQASRQASSNDRRGLRGITLYGIDSVMASSDRRIEAWQRLAKDLDIAKLDANTTEIGLAESINVAAQLLEGKVRGRVVVDVNR